jgi:hypothetical protein
VWTLIPTNKTSTVTPVRRPFALFNDAHRTSAILDHRFGNRGIRHERRVWWHCLQARSWLVVAASLVPFSMGLATCRYSWIVSKIAKARTESWA